MSNKPTLDEILIAIELTSLRHEMTQEARTAFKQQLAQLIADIIGDADHSKIEGERTESWYSNRNTLRHQQRQRAKERGIIL